MPIAFPAVAGLPPTSPTLTMVCHDAGETRAFQPVEPLLERMGITFYIAADGTARRLLDQDPHLVRTAFDQRQAEHSTVLLTGMVSPFQLKWAQRFTAQKKAVLGYFDGMTVDPQVSQAGAFAPWVSKVLAPSQWIANQLRPLFVGKAVETVGQPALEASTNRGLQSSRTALAQQLLLNPNEPIILWAGNYGPGYEDSFRLFCQAAIQAANQRLPGQRAPQILISPHPKFQGEVEQAILSEFPALTVHWSPEGVTSSQLLPVADLLVTRQSTISTMALCQNIPVVLVGPKPTPGLIEPEVDLGLTQRTQQLPLLASRLNSVAPRQATDWESQDRYSQQVFHLLGIPLQGAQQIANNLVQWLNPAMVSQTVKPAA